MSERTLAKGIKKEKNAGRIGDTKKWMMMTMMISFKSICNLKD